MTRSTTPMTAREFAHSEGAADWRVLSEGACAFFPTESFAESAAFVTALAGLPAIEGHRPDVDIRHDGVTVRLITMTGDYYGLSQRDLETARAISATAAKLGIAADPLRLQSMLIVSGGKANAATMPFWQAALDYERRPDTPDEDLVDPRGRGPAFWFEEMEEPRGDGSGAIHIGVWLPPELAEARIAAALAAGGHVVRDSFAPAFTTLADADGNEICIATPVGRD